MLTCAIAIGQKGPPSPKENGPGHPGLPIDGGLSLLLISGIAYGIYELKKKKTK